MPRPLDVADERFYQIGDVLANLYRVEQGPIRGGMATVYRVHHIDWDVDLAMKRQYARLFASEKMRRQFIDGECRHWINLGMHPNVVTCYYAREVDNMPCIFSEWVDGGSLKEWIGKHGAMKAGYSDDEPPAKLYRGTKAEIVERILDVAIQTARGLNYAHIHGLVHQDVKPENVLLTHDGVAKIADFGIARARMNASTSSDPYKQKSVVVDGAFGGTQMYRSPEQARKEASLTQRTDIWSWAVMLLEMLLNDRPWGDGQAASFRLQRNLANAPLSIPIGMDDLLTRCLSEDQAERPENFAEIEIELLVIYEFAVGRPYGRAYSESVEDTADSLNNRALSFLDIGMPSDAAICWSRALGTDHNHLDAIYNDALFEWRQGKIDDYEALRRMNIAAQNHPNDWHTDYMLAQIHLERGDRASALGCLAHAKQIAAQEPLVVALSEYAAGMQAEETLQKLEAKSGTIYSVAISPDETRFLTAHDNGDLLLWDAANGDRILAMTEHNKRLYTQIFFADGKRAASGGEDTDACIRIWDLETGNTLFTLSGHTDDVRAMDISRDEKTLVSVSVDRTARLWDLAAGKCTHVCSGHSQTVIGVCFIGAGDRFVSVSSDESIRIWNTSSGECMRTIGDLGMRILCVCAMPNRNAFLTGSSSGKIMLWNADTGECEKTLSVRAGDINALRVSENGRFVYACEDHVVRFFDLKSGCCVRSNFMTDRIIRTIDMTRDGTRILYMDGSNALYLHRPLYGYRANWSMSRIVSSEERYAQEERFLQLFDAATRALANNDVAAALTHIDAARAIPGHEDDEKCLHLSEQAGKYCTATSLRSVKERSPRTVHQRGIRSAMLNSDGTLLFSAGDDSLMKLSRVSDLTVLRTFSGHKDSIVCMALSADETRALSASNDRTVRMWDVSSGKELFCATPHANTYRVCAIALNMDGSLAAMGGDDGMVKVYDTKSGACVSELKGHTDGVSAVSFAPDGKRLLTGSWDQSVKLWDVTNQSALHTFNGHKNDVMSVFLSDDGTRALSGGFDRSMLVWDVSNESILHSFRGLPASVTNVSMRADGAFCFAGCANGDMQIFDVNSEELIRGFTGHADAQCTCISRSGRQLASGAKDGSVKTWETDWVCRFHEWVDWDARIEPMCKAFVAVYPHFSDEELARFVNYLQCGGFGNIKQSALERRLKNMQR